MTLVKYLVLPVLIISVAAIYWFLSYEPAGTAMLVIFGIAMGVMSGPWRRPSVTSDRRRRWTRTGTRASPERRHGNAGHCGCPGGKAANAVSGSLVLTGDPPVR